MKHCINNCKKIAKSNTHLEITTLIIPGLSDDTEMLTKLAFFIKNELGEEVPWHISAFSGFFSWKLKDVPDTSPQLIKEIQSRAKKAGLKNVYTGNI